MRFCERSHRHINNNRLILSPLPARRVCSLIYNSENRVASASDRRTAEIEASPQQDDGAQEEEESELPAGSCSAPPPPSDDASAGAVGSCSAPPPDDDDAAAADAASADAVGSCSAPPPDDDAAVPAVGSCGAPPPSDDDGDGDMSAGAAAAAATKAAVRAKWRLLLSLFWYHSTQAVSPLISCRDSPFHPTPGSYFKTLMRAKSKLYVFFCNTVSHVSDTESGCATIPPPRKRWRPSSPSVLPTVASPLRQDEHRRSAQQAYEERSRRETQRMETSNAGLRLVAAEKEKYRQRQA